MRDREARSSPDQVQTNENKGRGSAETRSVGWDQGEQFRQSSTDGDGDAGESEGQTAEADGVVVSSLWPVHGVGVVDLCELWGDEGEFVMNLSEIELSSRITKSAMIPRE